MAITADRLRGQSNDEPAKPIRECANRNASNALSDKASGVAKRGLRVWFDMTCIHSSFLCVFCSYMSIHR